MCIFADRMYTNIHDLLIEKHFFLGLEGSC